ncbi:hypothetical protein MXB_4697 [Myxobolus squamalis]|nr:hypothetical protein MXB_4697 [Myxobolus squamalis]
MSIYEYFQTQNESTFDGFLCYEYSLSLITLLSQNFYIDGSFENQVFMFFKEAIEFLFIKHKGCLHLYLYGPEIKNIFVFFNEFYQRIPKNTEYYSCIISPIVNLITVTLLQNSSQSLALIESYAYYEFINLFFNLIESKTFKFTAEMIDYFLIIVQPLIRFFSGL